MNMKPEMKSISCPG